MSLFSDSVRLIQVQSGSPNPAAVSPAGSSSPGETNHGTIIHIDKHSSGSNDFLAVPIVAIVFVFLYKIIKTIMAPFAYRNQHASPVPSGGGGLTPEEVAVLQKLQRTLSQMESRVEALETILIEQARTEKNYGSKL